MQSSKRREVLLIAALAAVLLIAGGFYGYREKQASNANRVSTNSAEEQDSVSDADAADVDDATLAEDPDTTTTSSDAPPTTITRRSDSSSSSGSGSGSSAPVPQTRSVSFVKGGDNLDGGVLTVSSNLSANETGTCTFKFSLNGTVRVERTSQITNSKVCAIEIPQSAFPKSAVYSFELTFVSTDGLATASLAYDIEVI